MNRRELIKVAGAGAALPFMGAFQAMAQAEASDASTVFELRVYHCADGKLDTLLQRFRDHTIIIFNRFNMHSVAYWVPTDDPLKDRTLFYILRHPSREAATANWAAFNADPEWKQVRAASEANGKIVNSVDSTFLKLTDFSPEDITTRKSLPPGLETLRLGMPGARAWRTPAVHFFLRLLGYNCHEALSRTIQHRRSFDMPDSSAFFTESFFQDLDARVARYDLLQHSFYTAWSRGELTREDLREYASEYWHHVSAFPAYLSALHSQLPDGELRRTVLTNLADEEGMRDGTPHSDMWMDFARGMGAKEPDVRARELASETRGMISHFRTTMYRPTACALAALYAYESRVPAIAKTKAEGLEQHYSADEVTRRYFTVHTVADVFHAQTWRDLLANELAAHPGQAEAALDSAENAARALWTALDGIEAGRQSRLATAA